MPARGASYFPTDMPKQSLQNPKCEDRHCPDDSGARVWYCDDCNSLYCDSCWNNQVPHGREKVARDGLPHEKTRREVVEKLKAILDPPADIQKLQSMHQEDEETTWFSVDQKYFIDMHGIEQTKFVTTDHGRFGALAAEFGHTHGLRSVFPHLVAFVGETSTYFSIISIVYVVGSD